MTKLHIKKGDTVYVNAGEDKGKTGKVTKVLVEKQRAIVEGVNFVSKSQKPSAKNPQGGIVKMEAPIHISNLNVVDPKSGKPTRIGRRKNEEGNSIILLPCKYLYSRRLLSIKVWVWLLQIRKLLMSLSMNSLQSPARKLWQQFHART